MSPRDVSEGAAAAVFATLDEPLARSTLAALEGRAAVTSIGAARGEVAVVATPSTDLALGGPALASARRAAFGAPPP